MLLVFPNDAIDAVDLWLVVVAVEGEAVVDHRLFEETGDCAEAEGREVFELVVVLQDTPDLVDSFDVLVLIVVAVVRAQTFERTIGRREIDANGERELPT